MSLQQKYHNYVTIHAVPLNIILDNVGSKD